MALIHAPICTCCGMRRTQHPSGMCSRCRRVTTPETHCRSCGKRTRFGNELCYRCATQASSDGDLDAAIRTQQTTIQILQKRQEGFSYAEIAEMWGVSKSTVYARCQQAIHLAAYLRSAAKENQDD